MPLWAADKHILTDDMQSTYEFLQEYEGYMMQLTLHSDNQASMQQLHAELAAALADSEVANQLTLSEPMLESSEQMVRGDPVTFWAVVLAAVSAGGAVTVAMSKDGFLSQLARILEKHHYVKASLKQPDGEELHLEGTAKQIEKMFIAYLKQKS